MKRLNIIGAGRVGRTLGALWAKRGVFEIQDVLCRTTDSARAAVRFMQAGQASERLGEMRPADIWLIATPDGHIVPACEALAASALLRDRDVVCHCSGALSSSVLAPAAQCGASIASVHPLKTFADPSAAVGTFAGTYCIGEGEPAAVALLCSAFEAIGGRFAQISGSQKPLYHAASVIVCNYLVTLMEAGLACYEGAGLSRETALAMMEPLVRETVDNVFRIGTAGALTGPIARGDAAVVAQHRALLQAWRGDIADLYGAAGIVALQLAREAGTDPAALEKIRLLLLDRQC